MLYKCIFLLRNLEFMNEIDMCINICILITLNTLIFHIARNIAVILFFHCNITMKYSRNIAEITLQRYHSNIKMSVKMNYSNIMVTYHNCITVMLSNIYVIFM